MHLVVGSRQSNHLDFTIVSGRSVPAGAQIYAMFSGDRASDQVDEHLFNTMTEEEYHSFTELAHEAKRLEADSCRAKNATTTGSLLNKLYAFLGRRNGNPSEMKGVNSPGGPFHGLH